MNKTLSIGLVLAVTALASSSCAGHRTASPSLADLRREPVLRASTYSADISATLARPVATRIGALPAIALDRIRKNDGISGYASHIPTESELELFLECFGQLPPKFQKAMSERLLGVYFIDNFAGGGMTDFAFDGSSSDTLKSSLYLVLILNSKVLKTSLEEWIAYRDSSPYDGEGGDLELRADCSGAEGRMALLHTLTHEAAHIYDFIEHATPYVDPVLANAAGAAGAAASAGKADAKDFTRGTWKGYAIPIDAYAIPHRAESAAYGLGPKLPMSVALDQYRALEATPFASFYGSGSWAEDFAEAATWSYLREKLGIGYEVRILRAGREEVRFAPDSRTWSAARTKALRDAIE